MLRRAFRSLALPLLGTALTPALTGCELHRDEGSEAKAVYDINWTSANGPTVGPVQVREGYHATEFTVVSCPYFLDWYRLAEAVNRTSKAEARAAVAAATACTALMVVDGSIFFHKLDPDAYEDHSTEALEAQVLTAAREVWKEKDWSFDRFEAMGGIHAMLDLSSHDAEWSPDSVHAYAEAMRRGFAEYVKTLDSSALAIGTGD